MKIIKKRKVVNTIESYCGCGGCGSCVGQVTLAGAQVTNQRNNSISTQANNCP